uniref:Uncharacterized protein n=1 Tax=Romanomermis culicivorax TaxID=13658 RepID=A0A915KS13_ROMCU
MSSNIETKKRANSKSVRSGPLQAPDPNVEIRPSAPLTYDELEKIDLHSEYRKDPFGTLAKLIPTQHIGEVKPQLSCALTTTMSQVTA